MTRIQADENFIFVSNVGFESLDSLSYAYSLKHLRPKEIWNVEIAFSKVKTLSLK